MSTPYVPNYLGCPKCGSADTSVLLLKKFDNIRRNTYNYLRQSIEPYMNNNSRGDTVEVYKEFLLCKCNRCSAEFFKDTLDTLTQNQIRTNYEY